MLLLCWLLPAASASAVDMGSEADGDRFVLVGSVLVERGETAGDVVVLDGGVTVAARSPATLGRRGRVAGDLVYGDDEPVQTQGSQVAGEVEEIDLPTRASSARSPSGSRSRCRCCCPG